MKPVVQKLTLPVLGLALMGLSACGGSKPSSLVKSVSIATSSDPTSGDALLGLTANLNTGNAVLLNVTIPVTKDGVEIGQFAISNNNVSVMVNMTQIAHADVSDGLLPNGNSIPVTGIDPSSIVKLQAGNSGEIYAAASNGLAMLGFALRISAFDNLGKYTGPVSIFNAFNMNGGIHGMAGTYFSPEQGKSGFAVFADATLPVSTLALSDGSVSHMLSTSNLVVANAYQELKFVDRKVSKSKNSYIQSKLYDLHSRRARLN